MRHRRVWIGANLVFAGMDLAGIAAYEPDLILAKPLNPALLPF
jgi:hypothetical protein